MSVWMVGSASDRSTKPGGAYESMLRLGETGGETDGEGVGETAVSELAGGAGGTVGAAAGPEQPVSAAASAAPASRRPRTTRTVYHLAGTPFAEHRRTRIPLPVNHRL